jgi:hypothetical protein
MGFNTVEEMAVASRAVENDRQAQAKSPIQVNNTLASELDAATGALADRILSGWRWRPLGAPYEALMAGLLDAPVGQAVKIEELAKKVGASFDEIKARLAKLSGRMKRIATPEEMSRLRTPFMLFAGIESEGGSTQYRLTPAGREAAKRYLGR